MDGDASPLQRKEFTKMKKKTAAYLGYASSSYRFVRSELSDVCSLRCRILPGDTSLGLETHRLGTHRLDTEETHRLETPGDASLTIACAICPPGDASPSCRLEISPAPSAHLETHLRAVVWRSRLRHQPTWGRISKLASGDLACAISPPGDASPSLLLEISPAPSAHLGTHLRAVKI
ncbi:hypothetical protein R1sor_026957 [Riccia sorocarpa]|uniref:Uncharacterized protein n=1 Tax=Riccia sorocarpa TaxID=122646 RepID=A0ABD3GF02_9MARC